MIMRFGYFGFMFLIAFTAAADVNAQNAEILHAIIGETDQKTPEVSTDHVRRIIADRGSLLIDTRPRAEFANGHIPTANNPVGSPAEISNLIEKLVAGDKARELVLYCNGPYCQASRRLAATLLDSGFTNVRRYQLGMPIWRALGGPTEIELDGATRIYKNDQTAVFLDARSAEDFAKGSLSRAQNLPPDQALTVQGKPMPLDDFNTRIVVFGRDAADARALADALSKRPWHNVAYFAGGFTELSAATSGK
jgi:rhodanese-related sulfurtransferase